MKKLPKLKFQPGNVGIQLNEGDRKYLIEVLESFWQAEVDFERLEEAFLCERLRHRMYGYKIDKTKYDRQRMKKECDGCGRLITYPQMHKCTKGQVERFDNETLARV